MVTWDIDRYEELQDDAWELDAWANAQDANAKRRGDRSDGAANRASARAKRVEAAYLLARYWVLLGHVDVVSGRGPSGARRVVADSERGRWWLRSSPSARW